MDISSTLIGVLGVVLTFGTAVCVHEFGHMMFALMRGVGVEAFAIGMGPKLLAWHWKGIEFSIRALPLGGFVKLHGMIEEEGVVVDAEPTPDAAHAAAITDEEAPKKKTLGESAVEDNTALQNKGLITKLLVFGGGVFMNYVTAILVTAVLLYMPTEMPRQALDVEYVEPGSMAEFAGLAAGDHIVAVDGAPVAYLNEVYDAMDSSMAATLAAAEKTAQTDAQPADATAPPPAAVDNIPAAKPAGPLHDFSFEVAGPNRMHRVVSTPKLPGEKIAAFLGGIAFHMPTSLAEVSPMSPAKSAGLKAGDEILSMQGKPVHSAREVIETIKKLGVTPIIFTIRRGEDVLEKTITPQSNPLERSRPIIGVQFASTDTETRRVYDSPFKALAMAPIMCTRHMVELVKTQFKFFQHASGKEIQQGLGGPIAIIRITANFANEGLMKALEWFLTLNLLLIIFNLLPIPVLDGGLIVLAIIEAIIRRPVPPRILNAVFTVATWALILFVIFVSVNDVLRG